MKISPRCVKMDKMSQIDNAVYLVKYDLHKRRFCATYVPKNVRTADNIFDVT